MTNEEQLQASVSVILAGIQKELKAPKELRNTFANFNYRSAEGILSELKPILVKKGCSVVLSDDVVSMGDGWVFIRATAKLVTEVGETVSASSFARIPSEKKGMDASQITGAASSYARKYALCGLFAIDDGTNDPDSSETHEAPPKQEQKRATPKALKPYPAEKLDDNLPKWKAAVAKETDAGATARWMKKIEETLSQHGFKFTDEQRETVLEQLSISDETDPF